MTPRQVIKGMVVYNGSTMHHTPYAGKKWLQYDTSLERDYTTMLAFALIDTNMDVVPYG